MTLPVNGHTSDYIYSQDAEESNWRKTRFGWVDSGQWKRPPRVEFERRIELVHPLIFSAMIVLCSIGALVWASEEYEWARVLRKRELTLKEKLERANKR